jgi:hypothetical protein
LRAALRCGGRLGLRPTGREEPGPLARDRGKRNTKDETIRQARLDLPTRARLEPPGRRARLARVPTNLPETLVPPQGPRGPAAVSGCVGYVPSLDLVRTEALD